MKSRVFFSLTYIIRRTKHSCFYLRLINNHTTQNEKLQKRFEEKINRKKKNSLPLE
jgi:hypothetical protein